MNIEVADLTLASKYNQPVPRYTSYPTVPNWTEGLDENLWKQSFVERFESQNHVDGMSLYLHLPFCESLCTYCGCNKRITTNHTVESEYIDAIQKEWLLYRKLMTQTPVLRELHLGGGTPTFFSPENLKKLIQFILKTCVIHPGREFSIEGHPNNTSPAHLAVLASLGFRRISYGVQDNDPEVQRVINRIQPLENLVSATNSARAHGFQSVNYDLIYGLPLQTELSIRKTIQQVIDCKPDRIAYYSYAHVPWTSKAQRLFNESDLPAPDAKLNLYLTGKELLLKAGYEDIGMDHFALPSDELFKARAEGKLHRNFMGYTTQKTGLLLGLGVSAISDAGSSYAQNRKALHDYYACIRNTEFPIAKGCLLTTEDIVVKKYILDIICKGKTDFQNVDRPFLSENVFPKLQQFADDALISFDEQTLQVELKGKNYLRNICSAFDRYLGNGDRSHSYSNAI